MMKPRRKLLLHIGLHKTATTFLQSVLAKNIDLLAQHGVKPAGYFNEGAGNHHKLLRLLKEGEDDMFFQALDVDARIVFASTEGFTTWLDRNTPERNMALVERLRANFEVEVIVFIRRQDFLKESVFGEVATNGYRGTIENENHYNYDFDGFLTKMESLFGRENVKLGLYRDDIKQNVVGSFFKLAGLTDVAKKLDLPGPQRISLTRRKVALLAALEKTNRKQFRHIRAVVVASDKIVDDGCKYQMAPKARRAFLDLFIAGNDSLAQRYGFTKTERDFLTGRKNPPKDDWSPLAPFSDAEHAVVDAARAAFDAG